MSIGVSILLIAVGAILRYAVTPEWQDVNEDTLGLILMWVGGLGLAISLIFGLVVTSTARRALRDFDADDHVRLPLRKRSRGL